VDEQPTELMYVTLGGIGFSASEGPSGEGATGAAHHGAPASTTTATSPVAAAAGEAAALLPPRIEQRFAIQLHTLQIDNQRYNTAYPVTLASTAAAAVGTDDNDAADADDGASSETALRVVAVRDVSFAGRKLAYLRLVQVHVQPLSLWLDEESVRAFLAFLHLFDAEEQGHGGGGGRRHAGCARQRAPRRCCHAGRAAHYHRRRRGTYAGALQG